MNENNSMVGEIMALPIRARVAFALVAAELVVQALAPDPEGLDVAKEALSLSWEWTAGRQVRADDLADYVDSPTPKDLGMRELNYTDDSMIGALIAVTLAVGYTARQAYRLEGGKVMSEPMWEIDDDSLEDIVKNARLVESFDAAELQRRSRGLIDRYSGGSRDAMGDPISRPDLVGK